MVGWSYFAAAAVAQALVALTGGHYAADALGLGRPAAFALAATTLALALAANLYGLRVSARLQLVLAAAVAFVLVAATLAALPRVNGGALSPFMPGASLVISQRGIVKQPSHHSSQFTHIARRH